jgi:hypothetical protein
MDYMHFRFFSASMGRFQKPDSNFDNPGNNPQGWNLYSYVKGNPVNFNDPTGHQAVDPDRSVAAAKDQKGSHSPLAQGPGDLVTGKDTAEQSAKKAKAAGDPNAAGQAAPKEQPKPAVSADAKLGAGVAVVSTGKEIYDKMMQLTPAEEKVETNLVGAAKEVPVGKILTGVGAAMDLKTVADNIFTLKGAGSGLTPQERNDTLLDLGVNLIGLGVSAALEGETVGLSSIPLAITAGAVGTDIGKLANAYLPVPSGASPSSASPDANHVRWPGPY